MKTMFLKVCALLVLLACATVSEAQIGKGMKLINGSGVFYNNVRSYQTGMGSIKSVSRSLTFAPSVGFFLSDKFCIGLALPLGYSQDFEDSETGLFLYRTGNTKNFTYGFSPYARYYIGFTEKFYGFFDARVGFNFDQASYNFGYYAPAGYPSGKFTSSGYAYTGGLNFGLTYFLSSKLAMEASLVGLKYTADYSKFSFSSNYDKQSSFALNYFPSGINLGVSFYLK